MPAPTLTCPWPGTLAPCAWQFETTAPRCPVNGLHCCTCTGEGSPSSPASHAPSGFCPPPPAARSSGLCSTLRSRCRPAAHIFQQWNIRSHSCSTTREALPGCHSARVDSFEYALWAALGSFCPGRLGRVVQVLAHAPARARDEEVQGADDGNHEDDQQGDPVQVELKNLMEPGGRNGPPEAIDRIGAREPICHHVLGVDTQ